MAYEYLEDVAVADVAFRVWSEDLPGLFIAAADATMNVMIAELDSIRPVEQRLIELEPEALDILLFEFLQEVLYYKDTEKLLLRVSEARVEDRDGLHLLQAKGAGEPLDQERHRVLVDIKAVAPRRLIVERTDRGWEAFVVLDV